MHCPACGAENPAAVKECAACKSRLSRPSRRRELTLPPDPWSGSSLIHLAYRSTFYGLIPFAGLILGPFALVLGLIALYRYRGRPPAEVRAVTWLVLLLNSLLTITNWLGVYLMIHSLAG